MDNTSSGRPARDSLSTVSTILGLVLFTILVITILVRRVIVNRHLRNMRAMRIAPLVPPMGAGFDTRFGIINRGDGDLDSSDEHEPRTMAIGARAALLKRPIIWEDQITLDKDESEKRGSIYWHQLQPTALQMTTPHTTAQFPAQGQNQAGPSPHPSSSRSLPRLFFHHNSAHTTHGSVNAPEARNPHDMPTSSSTQPPTQLNMPKDSSTQEIPMAETLEEIPEQNSHAPHPVHVTVLISMPDATRPAHSDKKTSQLRKSEFKEQNRIPLPSLVLGTTQPNISLPSLRLKQEELDTWWDLPSYSPHNLYNTPRGIALGPGLGIAFNRFGIQMNPQLAYAMAHERRSREHERERAHRHYPVLLQDLRMSSAGGGR